MLAITHAPSQHIDQCKRTYVAQTPVDYDRALDQHEGYCRTLHKCGAEVRTLEVNREFPDCAFVEDTAIVLDELAVLAAMGEESRRAEPDGIEPELRRYREVHRVELPATIEGGDVLRMDRTLLVGLSSRTTSAGISAFDAIVRRHGYRVVAVPVRGCLHLKTACTALPDGRLLVNPAWLDVRDLGDYELVPVPEDEPWGANIAFVGTSVCVSAAHVQTTDMIREIGFDVQLVDLSEFARAEGGVTCLSLVFDS